MISRFISEINRKEVIKVWVYCKYITRNGHRIYPKGKKVFRFWVDDEKQDQNKKR